ncbi:hypothetical protein Tdes44962_MAKER01499 [Teratosphaeria destructans]|uniref:Uncharacterized protein n=1 Tax=Teratosphaeria destructans TaxID=418781 RepID=A0A9W7SZS1_9PEZI|nr:hypothetical protein Tdes44962_MAKER01499 [Teratosphaeria destructans]
MPVIAHHIRITIARAGAAAKMTEIHPHHHCHHHFTQGLAQTASHWQDLLRKATYDAPLWIVFIPAMLLIALCVLVAWCVVTFKRRHEGRQMEWDSEVPPAYDDEGLPAYEDGVETVDDKCKGLVELEAPPYEEGSTMLLSKTGMGEPIYEH